MNHGRTKSRVLASVLATALLPAFAFGVTWMGPHTHAQAKVDKAGCQVHAVLASKEGDGKIPKDLAFLKETLQDDAFAAYKGYHLIDKKQLKLKIDKVSSASFKSGHKLRLTLLGGDENKLKLHADLTGRDGKTSLFGADYSIDNNGQLLVAAGQATVGEIAGKLFFAIQCAHRS
jgi:hypothetical protein